MSSPSGWPASSPSGRLLTISVTPRSFRPGTSSGPICPPTSVLSSSCRCILTLPGQRGEQRLAVALQLCIADPFDHGKLGERARLARGHLAQGRIVEDDIGRHPLLLRPLAPPFA